MSAFQDATYSEYRFTAFDALTMVITKPNSSSRLGFCCEA